MKLDKSLRMAIAIKNIKHQDLANSIGVSNQQVSRWLRTGIIKCSMLTRICDYFEMLVSEFVALGEEEKNWTKKNERPEGKKYNEKLSWKR